MRTRLILLAALLLATPASGGEDGGDGRLTEDERQEMLRLLDESKATLLELIDGLSAAQWDYRPGPDRWSVGQCAEHIVLSERALFETAKRALAEDPNPDWQEKTRGKSELLKRVLPNRNPGGAGGAQAPQEIRPTQGLSHDQVVAELESLRAEIIELVRTIDGPMKQHTQENPFPVFGTLNAYDWLIYIPLHTIRHSKQIVEVKESPGYPAS